jgi:orotidine-5'-phosphate decarboxylase
VLGLDPDPAALWPVHGTEDGRRGRRSGSLQRPAAAALAHCSSLIDATAECCVAVKLQLARFEALGPDGWRAAHQVALRAREAELLVIADGKRGDIDVSAGAYASALFGGLDTPFGHTAGIEADLVTVNPLMGRDALAPFIAGARARGGGVLVLVRTSNPGARDVQDLALDGGETVWERIARIVDELGADCVSASGLSDVGAVIGATEPGHLARARELMSRAVFLLPGVGAQGGRVEDLEPAFCPDPAAGLITASRAIADAYRSLGGQPAAAAREKAQQLQEAAWSVSQHAARHPSSRERTL